MHKPPVAIILASRAADGNRPGGRFGRETAIPRAAGKAVDARPNRVPVC